MQRGVFDVERSFGPTGGQFTTAQEAAARSATLSHILEGRPVHLGQGGQLDAPGLHRHAVSEADIKEALRGVGLDDHSRSRLIILEPSGKISVLKQG